MPKNSSEKKIQKVSQSLAHLLAAAVLKRFPKAKLGIGPTIENGFYYDFEVPRGFAPEDIKEFEKTIKQLIKSGLPFKGKKITPAEGRKLFKDQPFKLELIKDFGKETKKIHSFREYTEWHSIQRKNLTTISGNKKRLERGITGSWGRS